MIEFDELRDPLVWRALAKAILLPPAGPLLLAIVGLAILGRRPRAGRALALIGVLSLAAFSMPAVSVLLVNALDATPAFDPARPSGAQAVVILGSGVRRDAAYGGDTLGRHTLERVRYGARVARQTSLPVLVSGGSVFGGDTEASLMKRALEDEFGVPVRWAEDRSRTTHENAVMSAAVLRANGIDQVILVVHAPDVRRATAEFKAAGIATVAAPIGIASAEFHSLFDFMPSLSGLTDSYYALYEILGNAWLVVSGI
jgi:uncharacterized SAM-binding protein YcdF (DUF218 family)